MKVCGVTMARLQEHSWAPTLFERSESERGNHPVGSLTDQQPAGRREGPLPTGTDWMGRRTCSSPRPGKPVTWRRGPVCSQFKC